MEPRSRTSRMLARATRTSASDARSGSGARKILAGDCAPAPTLWRVGDAWVAAIRQRQRPFIVHRRARRATRVSGVAVVDGAAGDPGRKRLLADRGHAVVVARDVLLKLGRAPGHVVEVRQALGGQAGDDAALAADRLVDRLGVPLGEPPRLRRV